MTEHKELPWMGALYRLTANGTANNYNIFSGEVITIQIRSVGRY